MTAPAVGEALPVAVPLVGGPVVVRGAVRVEETADGILPRRFGEHASRRIVDDFMRAAMTQSAGVRLAFRTAARTLHLTVHATKLTDSVDAPIPAAVYDLCAEGRVMATARSAVGSRFLFSFETAISGRLEGPADTLVFSLDGVDREYELWLPYTDEVEVRGLRADAPVHAPRPVAARRWVHHGSSISHGYLASRITSTWPVRAAHLAGVELVNLAYSGNALLDQSTARTLAAVPADLLSVKLGINIVNGDHMRLRVFRSAVHGFLDTVRDGNPEVPLLVVSPVCCPPVEECPGPTLDAGRIDPWTVTAGTPEQVAEGKLSLQVIRRELADIVAARREEDLALGYLDGSLLYGPQDEQWMPMPDNLHPGDDVNALIAERFAALAFGPGGWFAGR